MIYLIGSLRNPRIPIIGNRLRKEGFVVWDDWFAGGKVADDEWKSYEEGLGHTYIEALSGDAANHVFHFDRMHLDISDCAVLVCPAGKSAHLELGYMIGKGKRGYILLDTAAIRWDVMLKFATNVFLDINDLVQCLRRQGG
jgi:hypothetical protein